MVYHLPISVIEAKPAADGTAAFTVTSYPDLRNAYTLDAYSVLATHTLKVDLDSKGMLTTVAMNGASTEVATTGIAATQAIVQEQIKAEIAAQAAREAEKKKRDEKADDAGAAAGATKPVLAKAFGPAFYTVRQRIEVDGLPTVELVQADFAATGVLQAAFPVAGVVSEAGPGVKVSFANTTGTGAGAEYVWDFKTEPAVLDMEATLATEVAPRTALPGVSVKFVSASPSTDWRLRAPGTLGAGKYKLDLVHINTAGKPIPIPTIELEIK